MAMREEIGVNSAVAGDSWVPRDAGARHYGPT
jgi:hypothetical protein